MKRTFIAMAVLAATGTVMAQSNVTIWGIVDADLSYYKINNVSKKMMSTSGNSPSQLGFRGSEDLGGGLAAHFWLEGGLLNDTGDYFQGLPFGRRSTVSVSSKFGEIRLGRENTASFWNNIVFDPFASLGPGAATNITIGSAGNGLASANPTVAVFTSNAISYLYGYGPSARPYIGKEGIYGHLMVAAPENSASLGKYTGGRVGYSSGPLNAAISYAQSKGPAQIPGAINSEYKDLNLGAWYDFGVARLMAHAGTTETDAAQSKFTHWSVGATIPFGVSSIPISYTSTKQNNAAATGASQFAIGYVYNLSKRTALYTTASQINNKNGAKFTFRGGNGGGNPGLVGEGTGRGYDIGMRHIF